MKAGCVGLGERRAFGLAVLAAALVVALTGASACGSEQRPSLKLIYAGSVIVPFDDLAREYRRLHPDVRVLTESHGSIQCIRQVTELKRRFDVLVTADYSLIPPLMYEVRDSSGRPFASWYLRFATNRMVLAYSERSRYADELTNENWPDVLARPGVRWGLADPRFDAAGYRALMVLQLAERHYGDAIIFEDLTLGRFTTPLVTERSGGIDVILVPELLQTEGGADVVLRGASIQLLPLLESGDVDYAFEYESVVRQRGLKYLVLPREIDLGSPHHAEAYRRVVVRLDMQRFASVKPEFRGELIGYGMTIPVTADNAEQARDFIAFALGPRGRRIFDRHHQPLLDPVLADRPQQLPSALRELLAPSGSSGTVELSTAGVAGMFATAE